MGFRFRRSFKIAPGVRFNINKKSAGLTFGPRGAHYTINTKGQRTASVGIPGTGLSYVETKGGGKSKKYSTSNEVSPDFSSPNQPKKEKNRGEKRGLKKPVKILLGIIVVSVLAGIIFGTSLEGISVNWIRCSYNVGDTITLEVTAEPEDAVISNLEICDNSIAELESFEDGIATITFTADGEDSIYFKSGDIVSNSETIIVTNPDDEKKSKASVNDEDSDASSSDEDYSNTTDNYTNSDSTTTTDDNSDYDSDSSGGSYSGGGESSSDDYYDDTETSSGSGSLVWISQTGSKYHSNSSCSNMNSPQQVSVEEAEALGLTPCRKCY